MEQPKKINIGCGRDYKEGYLNIDNCTMFPDAKVDLNCCIEDLKFQSESLDEIYASHIAMYFRPEDMAELLIRCFNWLKVNGVIEFETSDLRKLARIALYRSDQSLIDSHALTNLFGTRETGPHKWAWSRKSLNQMLLDAGFRGNKILKGLKNPKRDFRIHAWK